MSAEPTPPGQCCDCCDCDCHGEESSPSSALHWLVALLLVLSSISAVLPSLLRPSPVTIYYGAQAPDGGRP